MQAAESRTEQEPIDAIVVTRDEFSGVIQRLDIVDVRLERIEKESTLLRQELSMFRSDMDARFDRFTSEMDARFDRFTGEANARSDSLGRDMNQRIDQFNGRIDSMLKWTVGTIALFGTIISVLMTLFKFF